MPEETKSIQFRYRTSPAFRTIHASGAYGGPLPNGDVFLSFFSERSHLPETAVISFTDDKKGTETLQVEKGLVREVEVGIILDHMVAKSLRAWLDDQIRIVEQVINSPGIPIEVAGGKVSVS